MQSYSYSVLSDFEKFNHLWSTYSFENDFRLLNSRTEPNSIQSTYHYCIKYGGSISAPVFNVIPGSFDVSVFYVIA